MDRVRFERKRIEPRGQSNQVSRTASGAAMRRARIASGLTQSELAALIGVSRPYVSMWESGRAPWSQEQAQDLERHLFPELTPGTLYIDATEPHRHSLVYNRLPTTPTQGHCLCGRPNCPPVTQTQTTVEYWGRYKGEWNLFARGHEPLGEPGSRSHEKAMRLAMAHENRPYREGSQNECWIVEEWALTRTGYLLATTPGEQFGTLEQILLYREKIGPIPEGYVLAKMDIPCPRACVNPWHWRCVPAREFHAYRNRHTKRKQHPLVNWIRDYLVANDGLALSSDIQRDVNEAFGKPTKYHFHANKLGVTYETIGNRKYIRLPIDSWT